MGTRPGLTKVVLSRPSRRSLLPKSDLYRSFLLDLSTNFLSSLELALGLSEVLEKQCVSPSGRAERRARRCVDAKAILGQGRERQAEKQCPKYESSSKMSLAGVE